MGLDGIAAVAELFTAVADVAMGFLFVQAAAAGERTWHMQPADAVTLALLAAASVLLYAAGVVLNDVADVEVDRSERPERPIPSGRIALGHGALGGLAAAGRRHGARLDRGLPIAGVPPGIGRHAPGGGNRALRPGPEADAAGTAGHGRLPDAQRAAGDERAGRSARRRTFPRRRRHRPLHRRHYLAGPKRDRASDRRQILAATLVVLLGVGMLGCLPRVLPAGLLMIPPDRWHWLLGLLGAMIGWRCLYAVAEPGPRQVRVAVAQGIMSLVVLDAVACLPAGALPWAAAIIAVLVVPVWLLGYWLEST